MVVSSRIGVCHGSDTSLIAHLGFTRTRPGSSGSLRRPARRTAPRGGRPAGHGRPLGHHRGRPLVPRPAARAGRAAQGTGPAPHAGRIWLMKNLSTQKRQKLMENMNKDIRLYTLRQAFTLDPDAQNLHYGYVDVFTHDNSPGSQWVQQLSQGTLISSRTETDDKHDHLHQGQAVLIADETAFPALAGILDFWKNSIPPIVILLCTDAVDYAYFATYPFPEKTDIRKITVNVEQQGQKIIELLSTFTDLEQVWGALENNAAKQVRHYFRNERKLTGKNNHIKGYWRLDKKR